MLVILTKRDTLHIHTHIQPTYLLFFNHGNISFTCFLQLGTHWLSAFPPIFLTLPPKPSSSVDSQPRFRRVYKKNILIHYLTKGTELRHRRHHNKDPHKRSWARKMFQIVLRCSAKCKQLGCLTRTPRFNISRV